MIKTETVDYIYNLNQHDDGLRYITSLFSTQVGYINSMMVGRKISTKKANKRIKKLYKSYIKTFNNLREINDEHKKSNGN
jgi:hypothetical protein